MSQSLCPYNNDKYLNYAHTGSVHINAEPASDESAYNLGQCFSIAKGRFTAFLIGKGGEIKLRQNDRIDLGDIFDFIGRLPMRSREIRSRNE